MDFGSDPPDFSALSDHAARLALAHRQLARLEADEKRIRAFIALDVGAARRRLAEAGTGPLVGAVIGVKDIIHTADFPTRYGSDDPMSDGPRLDAWCIERLKHLGGIILGKTVCTQFAYPKPGPTVNPHDPTRSPGGSSSGSAAAVAAGFVSFALGTQTAGSTVRPASYCGVTGFKPTYGLLPLDGVEAISTTLDHLGLFAATPRDAWHLASAMALAEPEVIAAAAPKRVMLLRLPPDIPQDDVYLKHFDGLAQHLGRLGVGAEWRDLPFPQVDFRGLQQELCYWEVARILSKPGRVRPLPALEALLAPYRAKGIGDYAAARQRRQAYQSAFESFAAGYDAVLLPAATGVAPPVDGTGDAVMSRFWTALHVPALSVPFWTSPEGLPLGLQLVGRLGRDRALMKVAQWMFEHRLG